jgi:membrane-associated phospholipid phosphatase
MGWLRARLSEPSSHAGIGTILMGLALFLPPEWAAVAQTIGMALGGSAVFKKG